MPSLDTNCILRWLLDDVPEQTVIVDALISSGESIHVSDVVFIETVFVLEKVKKISRETIGKALEWVIRQNSILCNREFFLEILPVYVGHPKLSFVDCYLDTLALKTGTAPLFTFDRKLANQLPSTRLLV